MSAPVSSPGLADHPFEHSLVLSAPSDWQQWTAHHASVLSSATRARVLDAIRREGITAHPFGMAVPAEALQLVPDNHGDVVHARETSAARALLAALRELSSTEVEYARRRLKMLVEGLLPRHIAHLRRAHPFIASTAEDETPAEGGRNFDLVLADLSATRPGELAARLAGLGARVFPHGRLIAALPFDPDPDTAQTSCAGWSIIETVRGLGFGITKIRWYASQSAGIVGPQSRGIFLVDARKSPAPAALETASPEGLIGLAGLPRSGTTLLTALLGAHTRVHAVYEPWNANVNRYSALIGVTDVRALGSRDPFDLSVSEFIDEFGIRVSPGEDWLLVKETTTLPPYTDAIGALLSKSPRPARRHLVWLVRKPFHVYLSELEARRKWWGVPEIAHSREVFEKWATRTLRSAQRLRALLRQCNASVVSYEALVRDPHGTVERLMTRVGIPFETEQLSFHKTVKRSAVKGDLGVAKNPQAVSDRSVLGREQEFSALRDSVIDMPLFASISQFADWADEVAVRGVISADDALVARLDDIPSPPRPAAKP